MERLEFDKYSFLDRISSINSYVDRNPHIIEPDMSKIMDCYVDLVSLKTLMIVENSDYKFPFLAESYEALEKKDTILKSAENRMRELILKRKVSSSKEFTELSFFDLREVGELLDLFGKMSKFGCYFVPLAEEDRKTKKKIICDIVSIAYDTWCNRKTDESYQYYDVNELAKVKEEYKTFKNNEVLCRGNCVGQIYKEDGRMIMDTNNADDLLFACLDKLIGYIDDYHHVSVLVL